MLTWIGPVAMSLAGGVLGQTATPPDPSPSPAPEHAIVVYQWAAVTAECDIEWTTLGGVAGVASNHTLLTDALPTDRGQVLTPTGQAEPAIFGPPLDGSPGRAFVGDTDGGVLDGDDAIDRAVGPFQFVPSTWQLYGRDGNGDGATDPQNLWDAAAGAAAMLCDKGVTDDLDGAFTAYFGTDEWNEWAHRRRLELVEIERNRPRAEPPRRDVVVNQADLSPEPLEAANTLSGGGTSGEEGDGASGEGGSDVGASAQATEQRPVSLGDTEVFGDWTGDGQEESALLVIEDGSTRFERRDAVGRPFGAPLSLDPHLPVAEPQQLSLIPVAGDWDGDGVDALGLIAILQTEATLLLFDERSQLAETQTLGEIDVLTARFVVSAEARDGPEPRFWKTVTAHDGTEVRLFRVGQIAVAESLAQPLADLLGAAAADGIELEGWGWRSHQEQIDLRSRNCPDVWATPAADCTPPTAVPGTSRHEFGVAVDFHIGGQTLDVDSPAFIWLSSNAATYGLSNLPSEPWHWSTDGG